MDFERAARFWDEKAAAEPLEQKMPRAELEAKLDAFLAAHQTLALATGSGDRLRCTLLEYLWYEGRIYIFTEGGHKFDGLARNARVAAAVYEPYAGMGRLASVQIAGTASVIDPESPTYRTLCAARGIGEAAFKALPTPLYLLEIRLAQVELLFSEFQKAGYSSRQHLAVKA
ncbi:pyridoxamine 5'-phosphate oxidase family protein [Pseudoramibacter sp. HA2172]|uniref:pyridoxamine 5'-phosphate oxidase family protein n=1 Tax=Pseudoramibacter faecis TaxID=3108534 RepID=UPI002E79BB43|nr:pyridoxamine 5'-phosphate oxidase family protein [Pseudoramibacter sp. HA2172]